jgi:hypothetical protein
MGTPVPADDLPGGSAVPDDDLPGASVAAPSDDQSWSALFGDVARGIPRLAIETAGNLWDVATGTPAGPNSHASQWSAPFANQTVTESPEEQNISALAAAGTTNPYDKEASSAVSNALSHSYDSLFGTGDTAKFIKAYLPQDTQAVGTLSGVAGIAEGLADAPAMTAEEVATRQAAMSPQSQGAAAAAPRVGQTTPELQQAIVKAAQQNGGAVNPDALARHVEADTLPVPIKLTEGQALQDPVRISAEQNMRGQANGALAQRFNEQNGGLIQNIQAIRDDVGPQVFTANPVEHGDALIKAYQDKDAAARADITAKYKALADANGGNIPLDGKSFLQASQATLDQQMKTEFLPSTVQSTLSKLGKGPMTFSNFENLRTTLAAEARKAARAGDGNAEGAISIVRDQLENMPIASQATGVKALADQARGTAKARFDALSADPAYKAAVNESVPPDRFVQKFVVGGTRDNVALMRQNLSGDPVAQQTMGVAAVDHLRRSANIDDMGNGNFSQANYNKQLQAMSPKLRTLVGPQTADTLEQLGNVARYTQAQPRGAFVNNSNTLVGALAEHGASALEHAANIKTGGIGGTLVRGALKGRAARAAAQRAIAPGAGLGVMGQ